MHGFARVNGTELWYEVQGKGNPLVLIHGSPLDARMWDQQMPPLSAHFRVVRYDVRGYGRSSVPADVPYRHEDDLAALLAFLEIDQAAILGLSMGGRLAVDFALAYPRMVSALVLAGSSLSGFPCSEDLGALADEMYSAVDRGGIDAGRTVMLGRHWFQPSRNRASTRHVVERLVADYSGWHWTHNDPVVALSPAAYGRLQEVAVPALCLVGEHDHPDILAVAATVADRVPGARQVVMPGVAHMVNLEDPEAFNAHVLGFLQARFVN